MSPEKNRHIVSAIQGTQLTKANHATWSYTFSPAPSVVGCSLSLSPFFTPKQTRTDYNVVMTDKYDLDHDYKNSKGASSDMMDMNMVTHITNTTMIQCGSSSFEGRGDCGKAAFQVNGNQVKGNLENCYGATVLGQLYFFLNLECVMSFSPRNN
ncbi:hypothetical protein MHU86_2447 [Fragilaria crotonensis]|nr:hypothetical protein MHU86_2447 [Fragilaria crotonensis]